MSLLIQSYDRLGVLLDPKTGKPKQEPPFDKPGVLRTWGEGHDRLPDHIRRNLDRGAELAGPFEPRGSGQGWEELLYRPLADGATVTAGAEAVMIPDFNLPANYMSVGRTLKYTLFFRLSSAITTPGTFTLRLRWGGLAGVLMAGSGAFAPDPTAAATTLANMIEFWVVQRTDGATGTSMTIGRVTWNDFDDASATTLAGNLNMMMVAGNSTSIPVVATVDTTVVKALSATYQASLATASMTTHIALLESLN